MNPDDNGIFVSSFFEMELTPEKAEHFRMDVSKLFDLKKPDQYSIRVKRPDRAGGVPVVSNVLKITIAD